MGRIVELLVGAAALTTIATFIIGRAAWKSTLKALGRKPESPPPSDDVERRTP